MIKRLFAAGIAFAVYCSAPALAENVPPIWNWSGFYAGVSGGWGFNPRSDVVFPIITGLVGTALIITPVTGTATGKGGGIIGGTAGINWQNGSMVGGFEGDISWTGIKTTGSVAGAPILPSGCAAGNAALCGNLLPLGLVHCTSPCESTLSGLATARGRFGFVLPSSLLIYGTGGAAFGKFSNSEAGFGTANGYRFGWTAGGGIEGILAPNWTWKAEYLFVDFVHKQIPYNQNSSGLQQNGFQTNIIRLGLNYKFGSGL